ncbi:hypothetical protein DPMN_188960 [Dreissena polymorpha]|uniref:Uncharacterized protein n=1 Tax=Dreissena polymorpha TaxID=45954 RepID=A0A9D4DUP9_DREPO|nr:hypothetical protein DPMN_188960 [Dreissena polymorpha]
MLSICPKVLGQEVLLGIWDPADQGSCFSAGIELLLSNIDAEMEVELAKAPLKEVLMWPTWEKMFGDLLL